MGAGKETREASMVMQSHYQGQGSVLPNLSSMQRLKISFAPQGRMNPGKVL